MLTWKTMAVIKLQTAAEKAAEKAAMEKSYADIMAQKPEATAKKVVGQGTTKEGAAKASTQKGEESLDHVTVADVTDKEKLKATVHKLVAVLLTID
ncbi:unnamed protein product [Linum trigynum]|uniref:Uncharacterized protein n=1 Tax=Linum trigynum TaxID=586398 RepID=A0AAV2F8J1_9ROSI